MTACENCGASLEGRRQGTRFCDSSCRATAWLQDHPARDSRTRRDSARPLNVTNGSQTPSRNGSDPALRRLSRNGRGVRPYVLPEDDADLILEKVAAARGGTA